MAQPWSHTLYDLPAFAGLEAVGRAYGVRFRLFGGTASRLAMALWHDRRLAQTLVDLCPFSGDVDLEHSGDDALTSEIAAAIDASVVDAMWCRWSIVGRQTAEALRARRAVSTHVPLRAVVFDSWRAAPVEDQAAADLDRMRVSLRPYKGFAQTPARLAEQDLEIFGLLLALNAAADLAIASDSAVGVDGDAAADILSRYDENGDAEVLARQPRLRRRLYYLTAALAARSPRADGLVRRLLRLLDQAAPVAVLPTDGRALVVSAALADDGFRADPAVELSPPGEADEDFDARYQVDPVFDFHGLSGGLALRPGPAPSSGVDAQGRRREFLHLAWRGDQGAPEIAAGFCIDDAGEVHQGPAVGGTLPAGGRWLRLDIGSLVERPEAQTVRIGVLQGRARDEADPTLATLPDTGGPGAEVAEPRTWREAGVLEDEDAPLTMQTLSGEA